MDDWSGSMQHLTSPGSGKLAKLFVMAMIVTGAYVAIRCVAAWSYAFGILVGAN